MKAEPSTLKHVALLRDPIRDLDSYPFCVPVIRHLEQLTISRSVCFLVGENGTGKSTLLEAIALNFGFGMQGGSRNMARIADRDGEIEQLSRALRLSWRRKPLEGFFLRAENLYNVATYIDKLAEEDSRIYASYGGKSLHRQSHGESLLALLQHRFSRDGFYVLDEPETALSPQRQLALLAILHQLTRSNGAVQFLIATHSPIILAYPEAQILSFDSGRIEEVAYEDTDAYRITSGFLANRGAYLRHLLE